jgi:F420-dependent oxidoreductase-like protein
MAQPAASLTTTRLFRFGFQAKLVPELRDRPDEAFRKACASAAAAEEGGFDAVVVSDHLWQTSAVIAGQPVLTPSAAAAPAVEAYTALASLAGVTRRSKLAALVSPVTARNPAMLAKIVTSLDVISGGRAILGIGAGWAAEEQLSFGMNFPPTAERIRRLEEAVEICRSMFDEDTSTFSGTYYQVDGAVNVPPPAQARVPIMVGGNGRLGTLRIAARHADACNVSGPPREVAEALRSLAEHCAQIGRDPDEIVKTATLPVQASESHEDLVRSVATMHGLGIEGVVISGPMPDADAALERGRVLRAEFG